MVPSMIAGLLPPNSRVSGVRCSAAARMTLRPVTVPPVKKMWSNGRVVRCAASSGPPNNTWTRSAGSEACIHSAMTWEVAGACSGGLTMTRLPAAKAAITGFIVSKSGKFHGAMTSTTPLGWFTISDRVPSS